MAITKETAEKQLDRIMGFFPRVDAKGSFLFALDSSCLLISCSAQPWD
jgi:hypothetical protein